MIILSLLGFLGIILFDFLPLWKKKEDPEIITFVVFFLLTLVVAFFVFNNLELPSPLLILDKWLKGIGLSY